MENAEWAGALVARTVTVLALGAPNVEFALAGWAPAEREVPLPLNDELPATIGTPVSSVREVRVSRDGRRAAYTAGWARITQSVIEHVIPPR